MYSTNIIKTTLNTHDISNIIRTSRSPKFTTHIENKHIFICRQAEFYLFTRLYHPSITASDQVYATSSEYSTEKEQFRDIYIHTEDGDYDEFYNDKSAFGAHD